ncbi:MAG: glycosyltransferase family 9 protein [Verrucomicrobiae bacterium]|nr:glycosyltransferase family 9 protein [Verrucomicrobiae bacterium]
MWNRLVLQLFLFVFRIAARIWPPKPVQLSRLTLERILIFSAAGIGDTLTDSVAVGAIKSSHPLAQVAVVAHAKRAMLVEHNPLVNQVIPYRKNPFRFFTLVRELRRFHPDLIVMLRGNDPDLWPLAYLVNRDAILSTPRMTRFGFLISHPRELPDWDQTHGVQQTLDLVKPIAPGTGDVRIVYQVKKIEADNVYQKLLNQVGIDPRTSVVFQLGGGARSAWRDWPAEHWVELGKRLVAGYQVNLLLTGGPEHRATEHAVLMGVPDAVSLIGKLGLAEVAALLTWTPILVSTDTGVMHLGFAVCRSVLALIHCNNPWNRVGPYGYGDQHLVAQLEPREGEAVSTAVDMAGLTPDQVWPLLEYLCQRAGILSR